MPAQEASGPAGQESQPAPPVITQKMLRSYWECLEMAETVRALHQELATAALQRIPRPVVNTALQYGRRGPLKRLEKVLRAHMQEALVPSMSSALREVLVCFCDLLGVYGFDQLARFKRRRRPSFSLQSTFEQYLEGSGRILVIRHKEGGKVFVESLEGNPDAGRIVSIDERSQECTLVRPCPADVFVRVRFLHKLEKGNSR